MSENEIATAILFAWVGFSWGQWWAERKIKPDFGMRLLVDLFEEILERRKMVGRAMTICATKEFECGGEDLSITLRAAGDPDALHEMSADE